MKSENEIHDTTTTKSTTEGDEEMAATVTRTRSSRSSRKAGPKTGTAVKKSTAKKATAAAKKIVAVRKPKTDSPLALAVAFMKGKKPMVASEIAKGVLKTNKLGGKDPAYNIAFALHKAAREGHTVKRTKDHPALYSLR